MDADLLDGQVAAQLGRIVRSQAFSESPRLQQFLNYIVGETLAGRAGRIKGYSIAHDVFQREDPVDTQVSAIVRVEAGRLRRRLDDYYTGEGACDDLRISVPKGAYVPNFEASGGQEHTGQIAAPRDPDTPTQWSRGNNPGALQRTSIAVLPFQERVTGLDDAGLAIGLTEDIITDLARLETIDVIALPSVRYLDDNTIDVGEVGELLGVSHVLRGSIRGSVDKVRVTARLIDAITGNEIWARRFDREPSDILALQDELAVKVVDGAMEHLASGECRRSNQRYAAKPEAVVLYNQAMDLGNPPSDPGRNAAALRSFEQVMQIDPSFAGGHAGAAYMHAFAALWQHSDSAEADVRAAIDLAEAAISISPDFGMSYTALAFAHLVRRNFDKALAFSARAVEAQPGDPYVMSYHGMIHCFAGHAERGIEFARRAVRLDPLNVRAPYLNILGTIYLHAGRFEEALAALRRNLERGGPTTPGGEIRRAVTYYWLDRRDEAKAVLSGIENYPDRLRYTRDWTRRSFLEARDFELLDTPLRELAVR
jgi:TolB-like protein/Tfp pilus assembly protein PilF